MPTETRLAKWGTSLGIRIPKPLQEAAHLKPGDKVALEIEDGAIVIRAARSKPRLKDLVNAIAPENIHGETDWGKARGNELW